MPSVVRLPSIFGLMASGAHLLPCVARHPEGATISIRLTPNAPRSAVKGLKGDRLEIRLSAPPVEGKANSALIRWISKRFGAPRGDIRLLAGAKSRNKVVLIEDADPQAVSEAVAALIEAT